MAVKLNDITSKVWSIKASELGEIVADIEDIKQTVMLIVLTAKGSVPFLPEFGCGIYDHVDRPVQSAAPLMLREIRNSVARWENRATIVDSEYRIEGSTIKFALELRPNFNRETDPVSSEFIWFELDSDSGTIYLIDQWGRRITTQLGPIIIRK